jgi:hypothetical protein
MEMYYVSLLFKMVMVHLTACFLVEHYCLLFPKNNEILKFGIPNFNNPLIVHVSHPEIWKTQNLDTIKT